MSKPNKQGQKRAEALFSDGTQTEQIAKPKRLKQRKQLAKAEQQKARSGWLAKAIGRIVGFPDGAEYEIMQSGAWRKIRAKNAASRAALGKPHRMRTR